MSDGKREQPRETRAPSHDRGPRRRGRRRGHPILFTLGTVLLVGVLTASMLAGIFMMYVKTTLTPTLDVDAEDYTNTMKLSSFIYYQDKESGEWEELQTLHGVENRIWVSYDQIPDAMWQAAVAIEDKRFFQHHGVDWKRTAGAVVNMFIGMKNTFGGSTLTQQLLKNMTKDDDNTVNRKVREIFRALEFEKKYVKEDILEMYLNTVFFGDGCYGVQTASLHYFGKDVSELSVAECASLISITNNPWMYGPFSRVEITTDSGLVKSGRDMNKSRQKLVLKDMKDQEYIDEATYEKALAEELAFTDGSVTADELLAEAAEEKSGGNPQYNSWFVDELFMAVSRDMADQLGITMEMAQSRIRNRGYHIYSTVDPEIQSIAESVYEDRSNLDLTSRKGSPIHSAITIIDPYTGNVVAMVGDLGEKQGNLLWNYATGQRQVGSSIKPLTVYAPALDAGVITMASTFDNYPVRLLNNNPWPKNSPQGYTGWTTLSKGVGSSINTVAVRVEEMLGNAASFDFATENLGLPLVPDDENTAALGLGGLTHGVSTLDMAAAYAAFPNDGMYSTPKMYTKVTDAEGNVILENTNESRPAMKETTAYFMNKLLRGVITGGTGGSANFGGMTIAGKTGTTSQNYDRYFVGYTPYYCAAVWCGYDNNEKIIYSGNPSITMWKKVMSEVHKDLPDKSFLKPNADFTTLSVCLDSGMLATEACAADSRGSRVASVEVAAGTGPSEPCTMHVMRDYCTEGKCLAFETCPLETVAQAAFLDYTREDYGENIVADDDAFLVSKLELIEECPVHGAASGYLPPEIVDPDAPSADPEDPNYDPNYDPSGGFGDAGGTGTEPVEPVPPTEPTEPTVPPADDPSGGFGDAGGEWWSNMWANG